MNSAKGLGDQKSAKALSPVDNVIILGLYTLNGVNILFNIKGVIDYFSGSLHDFGGTFILLFFALHIIGSILAIIAAARHKIVGASLISLFVCSALFVSFIPWLLA